MQKTLTSHMHQYIRPQHIAQLINSFLNPKSHYLMSIPRLLTFISVFVFYISSASVIPPNIHFLELGYNIFFGNPLPAAGTIVDPGFGQSIFKLKKSSTTDSSSDFSDSTYLEPEGVMIIAGNDCSIQSSATELSSMQAYASMLSQSCTVTSGAAFGSFSASFSASTEYQNIQQTLSQSESAAYAMSGVCTVYEAIVQNQSPLSQQFMEDAMNLDPSDLTTYYSFFQKYGTHYITELTMGAEVSMISTFTSSALQTFQSTKTDVETSARASFFVSFGITEATSQDDSEASDFASNASYSDLTTLACTPPSDGNPDSWFSSIANPLPISYTLSSIADVFTSSNFGNSSNFTAINASLGQALDGYCGYLKSTGSLSSCQLTIPTTNMTGCLLCAGGCGGEYTIDNGVFDMNGQDAADFMDYPDQCNGGTIGANADMGGVHMCCIPDGPSAPQGITRLCTSCGGSFPREMYQLAVSPVNWLELYDSSCEESLEVETLADTQQVFLCSSPVATCNLCLSCGEEYIQAGFFSSQLGLGSVNAANQFALTLPGTSASSFLGDLPYTLSYVSGTVYGDGCAAGYDYSTDANAENFNLCCQQVQVETI